jgi:hypothetical protein
MRKHFITILLLTGITGFSQPAILKQAIITTKTTITSTEGEEDNNMPPPPPPGNNGEEMHIMRMGGDGETKSVTYLKNGFLKTVTNTEMGNTVTIRDIQNRKTTTLMEMMGTKTGFYTTDEEQEDMRKKMDSMMQSRAGAEKPVAPASREIVYAEGTKKIAGFACKKAWLFTNRKNGLKDSSLIWYCPDFKFEGIVSTGGVTGGPMGGGFGNAQPFTELLKSLPGYPMEFEMNLRGGRKMIVEVTKLETNKEIADKEFEIPKGYEIKSFKDLQNTDGPGIRMQFHH